MANKYSSQAISGYNSSPPPDDGSTTAANEITWSGIKGKLGDPVKNQAAAIDSAVLTAFGQQFGYSIESVSTDLTLGSGDTNKFILATGTHTLTFSAAATAGTSSLYAIINGGTGVTTLSAADNINGAATIALDPGDWALVGTDGATWEALRNVSPANIIVGSKNRFINGGCEVSQRSTPNLSTSFQYGAVDRFLVAATAGAVSAGTVAQDTASPAGRTGYSLKVAGATLTGSAIVSAKQRIESKDAVLLKNANASVSLHVYQDTGGAINYTITIKKPTATDNYAATTTIATSSAISVASATDTQLTFANQALGDCSAGLEIQVDAACGAVTTKNFHFTEWQIEEGRAVTAFERRSFERELRDCQRYYEKSYDYGTAPGTASTSLGQTTVAQNFTSAGTYVATVTEKFKASKRAAPTITQYSPSTGTSGKVRDGVNSADVTPATSGIGLNAFTWNASASASNANMSISGQWAADAEL